LFRGYLLGKLRKYVPLWAAILVTSLLFGFVHGAWNVGIDVFALSIVLCLLRVWTKTLWAPILLHMLKNAVAFYLLFINPLLLGTLGG
jgi:membrane protease YdiL (CAAX protease family)